MSFPPPAIQTSEITIGAPDNKYLLYATPSSLDYKDPAGATGTLIPLPDPVPDGTNYSDYLYWNPTASGGPAWEVGSTNLHLGINAGKTNQGIFAVAIGRFAGNINQGSLGVAIGNRAGENSQKDFSVAIGASTGQNSQGESATAIGPGAGNTNQGDNTVAVGNGAGNNTQGNNAVAIGNISGNTNQGSSAVAIGNRAGFATQGSLGVAVGNYSGGNNQGNYAVAIGNYAGYDIQTTNAIAIGNQAGKTVQGANSVAIGNSAGNNNQGQDCVALGNNCGKIDQGQYSIAIGLEAGNNTQGASSVAIGIQAGNYLQGESAVAIGAQAGSANQASNAIAIGNFAGVNSQGINSIALGYQAGLNNQNNSAISIGYFAGKIEQKFAAISIGTNAGSQNQSDYSISIGSDSGFDNQKENSIAIGAAAGQNNQNEKCIAIGFNSGRYIQQTNALAIGSYAGNSNQGTGTIALGYQAGQNNQNEYAIAIGYQAGLNNQASKSIIINATDDALDSSNTGLYINPIRDITYSTPAPLYYNSSSKEVYYNTALFKSFPVGKTITVDGTYGSDTLGLLNRYYNPFKTITFALAVASPGELVFINPGIYEETLTVPDNVSLQGAGTQCVVIRQLNVSSDTTLITAGTNCRIENFTAQLSSSNNVNLVGIHFNTDDSSITTKLRNSVWTITSNYSGASPPYVYGALSDQTNTTSPSNYNAANAIQRSTINVICAGNGRCRGIYINGANRFSVRDMVVYARGNGNNIVGAETVNASGYLEIKTSTIGGVLYDVNRTSGNLLIGFTDLLNNKADGNSFSTVVESSTTTFGIIGDPGTNSTYYLVPGTIKIADLPATAFQIPIPQNMILINGVLRYTGTIGVGVSITLNVYKNADVLPGFSITLNQGENTKVNNTKSIDFTAGDTYHATIVTVGNPGTGTLIATLAFY